MHVQHFLLQFCCLFLCLHKALSAPKRKLTDTSFGEPWLPISAACARQEHDKDFGEDLKRLHTKNKLPAQEVASLLKKATSSGVNFQHPFTKQQPTEVCRDKNAARTFRRWMHKTGSSWGELYWADIPVWHKKKKQFIQEKIPFLLPHEIVSQYMALDGNIEEGMPEKGTPLAKELSQVCFAWKEPEQGMLPLAIHGDGVPVQGRMNQSTLDYLTLSFPGSKRLEKIRIPMCCLDAQWNGGEQTINAMWAVIAWSLKSLGQGIFPAKRHDGTPFGKQEKERQNMASKPMRGKAALARIRGDWDFYCKWLGAPQYNVLKGMCWLCKCKPHEWRTATREDRQNWSLSKANFLATVRERDREVAPIFDVAGVTNQTLQPDWLHCVDEGFGALVCGQVLHSLLPEYGTVKAERVQGLWSHIQEIYASFGIDADKRLSKLTYKDIKKEKKPADLDAKAACIRQLGALLEPLCKAKKLDQGNKFQKAVYNVARHCTKVYHYLEYFNPVQLAENGEKLVSQYMALEKAHKDREDDIAWHAKPKVHLFQHILDAAVKDGLNPKDNWTYLDETNGGTLQQWFFRRGGIASAGHDSERVLLSFMNNVPWVGIVEPD